ncbi:MAG: type II toxin-antitoxin system VapC family toxin [Campylobacterota bacterium]|nr:type II toxin-antitoxin system VapC family toxin [Campylobacterota bacterium]
MSNTSNQIYISSASIWEIAIKEFLGKLKVDADLSSAIEANGFIELKISAICANATKKLEQIHRDPFDRMLIAQAIEGDMTLITVDRYIVQYKDVNVLSFRR